MLRLVQPLQERWRNHEPRPYAKNVIYASTVSSLDEDTNSEKSYVAKISGKELFESYIFLSINREFMLMAIFANLTLFTMHTYHQVFYKSKLAYATTWTVLLEVGCYVIIILDITSSILHKYFKNVAAQKAMHPRYWILIVMDVFFQILAGACSFIKIYYIYIYCIELFRLFRVSVFFYYISRTPGCNTIKYNLLKFGLVSFLSTHIASTIAYIISKELKNSNINTWMKDILNIFPEIKSDDMLGYIYCCFIILSAEGSLGYVGPAAKNDFETVLVIITMLIGMLFIGGIFLGTFTTLRIEVYREKAIYHHQLKLITKNLEEHFVPKYIKRKIKNYYLEFWSKERGTIKSKLLLNLPQSIQMSVYLDQYWKIFEKSNLLSNTKTGFQRALAEVMVTKIFPTGEVICNQAAIKNTLLLVTKGTIQLLSAEDMESPLISLGVGTILGEASLISSTPNSVQVVASSYCVIQCLNKSDFWRVALRYRKLHQSEDIYSKHNLVLKIAYEKNSSKDFSEVGISLEKVINNTRKYYEENKEIGIKCLYVVNPFVEKNRADEIFYRTKFPWILEPESDLIFYWDVIIVFIIAVTAICLPYYMAFELEHNYTFYTMRYFIQLFYFLDVVFQLFIITEDENGIYTTVKEIATKRLSSLFFHLDVIAAFPVDSLFLVIRVDVSDLILGSLVFIRLFKVHKIIFFLSKIENTFKFNVAMLRLFKYVVYILYLSYLMGAIYYICACRNEAKDCNPHSWAARLQNLQPGITYEEIFYNSFQTGFLILTLAGGGVLQFASKLDLLILTTFIVFGLLLFTYIAADYGATLILIDNARDEYTKNVMTIKKLSENEMYKTLDNQRNLKRIYSYLIMQWKYNQGQSVKQLLEDAPKHLYDAQQSAKYAKIYETIPIFQNLGQELYNMLSAKSELVYFSPNEIFVNGNEKCSDLYVVQQGYCELISGENRRVEKVVGPGAVISILEVIMGVNNLFFVRPITSVAVVKIRQIDIFEILRNYPRFERDILKYKTTFLSSMKVFKLFNDQTITLRSPDFDRFTAHVFKVPNDKTDPLYQDYVRGWSRWSYFRYLMLPFTILPEGRCIIIWEIIFNIMVFILIIFSLSADVWISIYEDFDKITIFFDLWQILGIYVRFHICYYNEDGILITHPRCTAKRYITSALFIDVFSAFPIARFVKLFRKKNARFSESLCGLNKALQLYRLPLLFNYFTEDDFKPKKISINVLKFFPITLVFLSICVTLLLAISTDVRNQNGHLHLIPTNNSIAEHMSHIKDFQFNKHETINLFLLALLWVTASTLQLGFSGVFPNKKIEVIILTGVMLLGYLLFTYILVIITNSQTTMNSQLTKHQSHMKHIIKFMKKEKISKELQLQAIEYFEYSWQQDHGVTSSKIISRCPRVLREDFLFDQYKKTFTQVAIFPALTSNVYRLLSVNLTRIYFLPDVSFIKINDIVSKMYIIHSGEVKVYDASKKLCETLGVGSIIGNFDNVSSRRTMVTFKSSGSIDLLAIEAKKFYSLMTPSINKNLQKFLCLKNLSYVKGLPVLAGKTKNINKFSTSLDTRHKVTVLLSTPLQVIYLLLSYFSFQLSAYVIAFCNHSYLVAYLFIIFFDVAHIVIIVLKFMTPYYDSKGQLIVNRKSIKKRLLHHPWFSINVIATIPLDYIFIMLQQYGYFEYDKLKILQLNRCLRAYNIIYFFDERNDILNSDLMVTKLASIFIYLTIMMNIQSCAFYLMATHGGATFMPHTWAYKLLDDGTENMICNSKYICSLYISTSFFTMSGYSIMPRHIDGVTIAIILAIVDKFTGAILIAKLSAAIQNSTAELSVFDHKFARLQVYLKRSFVSKELIRNIVNYTDQLWFISRGVQEPVLLTSAPLYLQEEIKSEAFGKHIYNNLVFCNCHKDFMRHLIRYLRLETYFKDDVICEQGDINETMYFIHQGYVEVFHSTDTEEVKVDELDELDCFGIIQGLFPRTPHTHTFKAMVITTVLTLRLSDWLHIMPFYPASKYQLYEMVNLIS